jgi:hypothetical protein
MLVAGAAGALRGQEHVEEVEEHRDRESQQIPQKGE